MCWVTAQRPGDCINCRPEDVSFGDEYTVRIKFCRGKTTASQGAHHIHTRVLNSELYDAIRAHVDASASRSFLFPFASAYHRGKLVAAMTAALRRVRPDAEARSLRRSTLCIMAAKGATERQLLTWSRHTTEAALRRYLFLEEVPHAEHQAMQDLAARALGPDVDAVTGADSASGAGAAPFDGLFTITAENGVIWNAGRAPSAHHERSSDGVVHPEWPIHLPDAVVKPYDLAKVDHMAAHDCNMPDDKHNDVGRGWAHDRLELTDEGGRYSRVPHVETATTRCVYHDGKPIPLEVAQLTPADVARMTALDVAAIVHPHE